MNNDNRFSISGSNLRELSPTEVDAVGGANCGDMSSWTMTTLTLTTLTVTSPACTSTTTSTTSGTTGTTTTRNEEAIQG